MPTRRWSDVSVASETDAKEVATAVDGHPRAATALALVLRGGDSRSVADGLVAESATYSTLQAGPEFRSWLSGRERRARGTDAELPVRVERDGDVLRLVLQRAHVRNAFNAAMRDALLEGLAVAAAEPSLRVEISGIGPAFCAGGDLDEFGTATDPASAHLLRVARSAGLALAGLAERVTARVHGTCIGAGIELPAFCGRVVAAPDASFALPEVAMGLIPGAGGTVSLPAHRPSAHGVACDHRQDHRRADRDGMGLDRRHRGRALNLLLLLDMAAADHGDAVVVQDGSDELTAEGLLAASWAGAAEVAGASAVAYVGTNGIAVPVALFAAAAAGIPYAPLNYRLGEEQLDELAHRLGNAFVIADGPAADGPRGPGSPRRRRRHVPRQGPRRRPCR